MPSATASGADAGGGSSARSREHKQGNQGRTFTVDQEAAVIRIRKCNPTAFYDILNLESVKTTCSDGDIKKAYRKQSLLTHPDKNGHEHADEAFKMVSRAVGVLGDKEKRDKFDRFGGDPDSRFQQAQAQNPFSGFASRQASGARAGGFPGRGGGMWEEELSPEEMFARFFGGGGGGFGGEYTHLDGPPFPVPNLTVQRLTQARSLSLTLAGVLASESISSAAGAHGDGPARARPSSRKRTRCRT